MTPADMIEAKAERAMDRLDAALIRGELTQADYDAKVAELHRDTEAKHKAADEVRAIFAPLERRLLAELEDTQAELAATRAKLAAIDPAEGINLAAL